MSEPAPTVDSSETAMAFGREDEATNEQVGHEDLVRELVSRSQEEMRLMVERMVANVLQDMARTLSNHDRAGTLSAAAGTGDSTPIDQLLETGNLRVLTEIKSRINARVKMLTNGKSYKRRVRNGREYWYEVISDPENGKKKDRYVGRNPPVAA